MGSRKQPKQPAKQPAKQVKEEVMMEKGKELILNLTQHPATKEQMEAGVVDLSGGMVNALRELLTFNELPDPMEILDRAEKIADLAEQVGARKAMIGGAPYLMASLEYELRKRWIEPLYAFSRRESVEEPQPDGSVKKSTVFRHSGFVVPPGLIKGY